MRLKPLNWRVFIKPIGEEAQDLPDTLASLGMQIRRGMDEDEIRRTVSSDDVGLVVAIGPLAWQRQDLQGSKAPEDWEDWCKVGDKVIFGRHAGKLKRDPDSGEWFMLINDEDIQAVIEPEDFSAAEAEVELLNG